jgi:hypothetical protein
VVTADLDTLEPPAVRLRRCDGDTGSQRALLRSTGLGSPLRRRVRYCAGFAREERDETSPQRGRKVILATVKIGDFDRFWNTFSTKGAEKRKQYTSILQKKLRD